MSSKELMKASVLLKAARERVTDPQDWTQGAYARDAYGSEVGDGHFSLDDLIDEEAFHNATRWCALGALGVKAFDIDDVAHATNVLERAVRKLDTSVKGDDYCIVSAFNDNHSHEEVLRLFDEAIELAKEQEAQ